MHRMARCSRFHRSRRTGHADKGSPGDLGDAAISAIVKELNRVMGSIGRSLNDIACSQNERIDQHKVKLPTRERY